MTPKKLNHLLEVVNTSQKNRTHYIGSLGVEFTV